MAASGSQAGQATEAPGRGALAYNLAGITIIVLLLAVGLAYGIDRLGRSTGLNVPALGDGDPIVQTIGGRELTIPTSWFRYGEQLKDDFASQADLRVMLALGDNGALLPVDVTLQSRNRARSSAALLDAVYLHQFDDGMREGVPGLVGKPLKAAEGYSGETVWYAPLSPAPFVAKCASGVTPDLPDRCLRTIHLRTGIAAVLSFDATALAGWRKFDEELALWLGQIGAL